MSEFATTVNKEPFASLNGSLSDLGPAVVVAVSVSRACAALPGRELEQVAADPTRWRATSPGPDMAFGVVVL